jgi:trans-2,3-dihydro-3-hydroxyanthranilate isomerase
MQVEVVRVFTRGPDGGNHLGIVDQLLGDGDMQAIAAEVGFSETIFFDPAESEPAVRIFTPTSELPFAGHPLVGLTWWLGRTGRPTTLVTGVGPVSVRSFGDRAEVDAALGQPVSEGAEPPSGLPPGADCAVVSMPLPYVVCDLGDPEAVSAVQPGAGWAHVYVHAMQPDGIVRARFLSSGLGIPEDPATGSAAVALAARRAAGGTGSGRLTIHQGEEMGHPSRIDVSWGGGIATIGGTVVAEEPMQIRRPSGPLRTSTP